jgi:hypothetical protein
MELHVASHGKITDIKDDKIRLDAGWRTWGIALIVVGVLALLGSVGYASSAGIRHFYFSYFHSFIFFLSLTLGSLFVVVIQHQVRAGWGVTIRRVAEIFSMNVIIMVFLFLPIVYSVVQGKGLLYPWAVDHHGEHAAHVDAGHGHDHAKGEAADQHAKPQSGGDTHAAHSEPVLPAAGEGYREIIDPSAPVSRAGVKADEAFIPNGVRNTYANHLQEMVAHKPILKKTAFCVGAVIFFGAWLIVAGFYYKNSQKQDESGDVNLTHRMQWWAPISLFTLAMTITGFAWFFIMTISPVWYSTMFGVYYFAGCMGGTYALLILTFHFLTSKGYVKHITTEHFHDMGKFLFGFTIFWAYISYSQYMLIWYANIPEETFWFRTRGATTAAGYSSVNTWGTIAILLVICRFAVPFLGLLSRHVKRFKYGIIFWAVWILAFHYIDLYWVVMPELFATIPFGLMEILTFVGIGAIWFGHSIMTATRNNLAPVKDPRLHECLAFENM